MGLMAPPELLPDPGNRESRGWPLPRFRVRRPRPDRVTDACFLAGLAMVAVGCGWIFPPAGLIVGGVLLAAFAWLEQRGREAEEQPAPTTVIERYLSGDIDEDD